MSQHIETVDFELGHEQATPQAVYIPPSSVFLHVAIAKGKLLLWVLVNDDIQRSHPFDVSPPWNDPDLKIPNQEFCVFEDGEPITGDWIYINTVWLERGPAHHLFLNANGYTPPVVSEDNEDCDPEPEEVEPQ